MGNQREIRQVSPTVHLGVAIQIREGATESVIGILAKHATGHFYTYVATANDDCSIPNMDDNETRIGSSRAARFIIQSGGKMWCGYEAFCDHIADVAEYLHDAQFFVGDEEDYIDEFQIANGKLILSRVHSGGWRSVHEYLAERFPDAAI